MGNKNKQWDLGVVTVKEANKKLIQKELANHNSIRDELEDLARELVNAHSERNNLKEQLENTPNLKNVQELSNYDNYIALLESKQTRLKREFKTFIEENTPHLHSIRQNIMRDEVASNKEIKEAIEHAANALESAVQGVTSLIDIYRSEKAVVAKELSKLRECMDQGSYLYYGTQPYTDDYNLPDQKDISQIEDVLKAVKKIRE